MGPLSPEHAPKRCVLVAVDFSPEGDAAVDLAITLAEAMKAPLVMLHVIHDPAHAPGFYRDEDEPDDKSRKKHEKRLAQRARTLRNAAEDMLRDYLERRRRAEPDRAVLESAHLALVTGTPASRIVEVAHERDARLIVMGTRGRSALSGILLGSNANRVVQLSRVPVTLVKAPESEKAKTRRERREG